MTDDHEEISFVNSRCLVNHDNVGFEIPNELGDAARVGSRNDNASKLLEECRIDSAG